MDLLKKLSNTNGPSGNESAVRDIISKEIKKYVNSVGVDSMGNLIAHKKGKDPQIMLAAHMDEVALMVKRIDSNGLIAFTNIGGVALDLLLGENVEVVAEKSIRGIITHPAVSSGKELEKLPNIEAFRVDTGLSEKELRRRGVRAGCYIKFAQKCFITGKRIFGKALDNRIGCFILLELAKKLKTPNGVYFVFTVQEEMGLYGAKTSAFQINPDWAIAVDVSQANDTLDFPTRILGSGPTITAKDGEFIANKCITDWLINIAEKNKIPYQIEASAEGTTDATNISTSRGGIPSGVVGVAIRSMHSAVGEADTRDINNAIKLLHIFLKKPPKVCLV